MRIDELRLDELTGYRSNPVYQLLQQSTSIEGFIHALRDAQYNISALGKGCFGVVFDKPGSNDVYKLFVARDKGYLSFLSYAKQNQNNPHLPKIHGGLMRVNMSKNEDSQSRAWIIVRLEKLENLSSLKPNDFDMRYYMHMLGGLSDQAARDEKIEQMKYIVSIGRAGTVYTDNYKAVIEIYEKYPQLAAALDWIMANGDENAGKFIDLHKDNVMRRGYTPVIIDPFSYFGD